jgi:serine/threonine protein kinase
LAEARITAGLEHANIVTVHACEQEPDQTPFYVMRLVEGRTLSEFIRDYHQPPVDQSPGVTRLLWRRLLQSFVAVCDGVAYAHAHQVLHRDLKPGNILVGEFGETVILDWGMARQMPSAAAAISGGPEVSGESPRNGCTDAIGSIVVGTPQYMAPEQAGGITDARSDVFGLGAMLYELLTNRPPYDWADGAQPADWMRLVREARFPPPRQLNPQAPRPLEAICRRALARDPLQRYQSADELSQEMGRYLAGEPASAWTAPFWDRGWRMLRRRHL